jgi:pyruvate/2-oxoglutarate dehydrogenase complex dihydrolipoamide dehydrogenase (E3) component
VLVAATGYSFPVLTLTPGQSQQERQEEVDRIGEPLVSGRNVVIAGGGATGVELAADILEKLPADSRKGKVTLICSTERLLADQPEYYSERCKQVFEELGGTIVFNNRVTSHVPKLQLQPPATRSTSSSRVAKLWIVMPMLLSLHVDQTRLGLRLLMVTRASLPNS